MSSETRLSSLTSISSQRYIDRLYPRINDASRHDDIVKRMITELHELNANPEKLVLTTMDFSPLTEVLRKDFFKSLATVLTQVFIGSRCVTPQHPILDNAIKDLSLSKLIDKCHELPKVLSKTQKISEAFLTMLMTTNFTEITGILRIMEVCPPQCDLERIVNICKTIEKDSANTGLYRLAYWITLLRSGSSYVTTELLENALGLLIQTENMTRKTHNASFLIPFQAFHNDVPNDRWLKILILALARLTSESKNQEPLPVIESIIKLSKEDWSQIEVAFAEMISKN